MESTEVSFAYIPRQANPENLVNQQNHNLNHYLSKNILINGYIQILLHDYCNG